MAVKVGELTWVVDTDTTKFNKGLKKTETQTTSLGKKFSGLGTLIKTALIAAAVVGVGRLSKSLILAASEAEETQNKFSVTFKSVAKEANAAADVLSNSFGLSQSAAKGLLADTGDLLSGFGFLGEEALNLSVQANQLAIDLSSFANVPVAQASAAITKGLLGEREAMKALGIAIMEADINQLAEDKGIVGELDRQTKAQLTLELALKQSANAIGDFQRSQFSFANQTRVAQARIEDLKVALGDNLLPIANVGVSIFNDFAKQALLAAEKLGEFTSSAEGAERIGEVVGEIATGIAVLGALGKPIFKELGEAILEVIAPFEELLTVSEETNGQFKVFGAISATLAGVISLIGTSIAGTVTNLIALGQALVSVGDLATTFWQALTGDDQAAADFKNQVKNVGSAFANLGTSLVTSSVDAFKGVTGFVANYREATIEAAEAASIAYTTTADVIGTKVTTALKEAGDTATETGEEVLTVNEDLGDSYDLNAERLRVLQKEYGTLEEIEKNWSEGALTRQIELVNVGVGSLLSSFGDLGEAFVEGELGWDSFAKAGLNAIASVLDALGAQLAAQAASLIGAAYFSFGASLSGLGPTLAGSAAAFASAGVVRGIAGSFEQGGTVPSIPGVSPTGDRQLVAVNGGEVITPADEAGGDVTQFLFQMDGKIFADIIVDNYINKGRNLISLKRGTRD